MIGRLSGLALALALLAAPLAPLAAGPATGCGLLLGSAAAPVPIDTLPEGTVTGRGVCGGLERELSVWTLAVDPEAPDLGVRDRPLFRQPPANPLVPIVSVALDGGGRLTLFRRSAQPERPPDATAGPDLRAPYRLFGTLCDTGAADPLHCGFGAARIKMRADVVDGDGDGALDIVRHSVSIWKGDRLRVLMFATPHAGRPLGNAAPWVETLALAGLI